MNDRIRELYRQAHTDGFFGMAFDPQKFFELIKEAIYDQVNEELIPDELINIEPDSLQREYLKGCNGGTVDALIHIKNFGVDIEQ
jgi:hypothetical protein